MASVLRRWLELEQVGTGQAFFSSYDLGASPGGLVGFLSVWQLQGSGTAYMEAQGSIANILVEKSRSYVTFYDPA